MKKFCSGPVQEVNVELEPTRLTQLSKMCNPKCYVVDLHIVTSSKRMHHLLPYALMLTEHCYAYQMT